jgi:hypothetical protein
MGFFHRCNVGFDVSPPLTGDTKVTLNFDPQFLWKAGLNILTEISTARVLQKPSDTNPPSMLVSAHLDTGASMTSIDINLAKHLKLVPIGESKSDNASGIPFVSPTFVVDLSFQNTTLAPFIGIQVGSCNLSFDLKKGAIQSNYGILLGRDILSRWNVVWNGPTSTVFISD